MNELMERITIDPNICHGTPCVRGTRVMVWQVVEYLAGGDTAEDILDAYPKLTEDDVRARLAYAAEMTRERILPIDISP